MKKEYVKPTSQFTELRIEERLAECEYFSNQFGSPECADNWGNIGPGGS